MPAALPMSAVLAMGRSGVAPLWRALCSSSALAAAGSPAAALAAALPLVRRLSSAASASAAGAGGSSSSAEDAAAAEQWPVIIAGGGPTGLTTALLLAKYGVRSVVLEKNRRGRLQAARRAGRLPVPVAAAAALHGPASCYMPH